MSVKMQQNGIIMMKEPSISYQVSPVILVQKKGSSTRFCAN